MTNSTAPTKIKERTPPQGAVGWDVFTIPSEQSFETGKDLEKLPKYKFPSVGSIPFSRVGGALVDTLGAGKDLFLNDLLGLGGKTEDTKPERVEQPKIYREGNPEITQAQSAAIEQEQDARRIQNIENWVRSISDSQSMEMYKRKQAEAHRLVGATVSKDEARERGHLDNEATSTLVDISQSQAKAVDNAEEEEKEISLAEATKPVVDLNSFMEGGTGKGQVNITATGGGGAG